MPGAPLTVEMELYFSCMVGKVVHFYQSTPEGKEFMPITDKLEICFKSVAAAVCSTIGSNSTEDSNASLSALSGQASGKFVRQWLEIDFTKGKWSGSFGCSSGG